MTFPQGTLPRIKDIPAVSRREFEAMQDRAEAAEMALKEIVAPAGDGALALAPGIHLTPREHRLFNTLLHKNGAVLSKEQLLSAIYFDAPEEDEPTIGIIDVYVCKIRKKLRNAKHPAEIVTSWGCGYALRVQKGD